FANMSKETLAARAPTYRPRLRGKGVLPRDRATAGVWAVNLAINADDSSSVDATTSALWGAWKKGLRTGVVGCFLLSAAVETGRDGDINELLMYLSVSFDPTDVRLTFEILWESDDARMHRLAVPHLPILLADDSLGSASLPLIGLLVVLGR